jgi:hypothetical protein
MRMLYRILSWGCAVILGGIGLVMFAESIQRQSSRSEGRIVRVFPIRSEIQNIFAPQALIDFARKHPSIKNHAEMVKLLESESLGEVWFATLSLDLLNNGELYRDVNYIYPAKMSHRFPTTQEVMGVLGSWSDSYDSGHFSRVEIEMIPAEVAKLEASSIVTDLLDAR